MARRPSWERRRGAPPMARECSCQLYLWARQVSTLQCRRIFVAN